jgi:putative endonuclease
MVSTSGPGREGERGEAAAAAYLRGRGWRILARNWRFGHKEIDLVAERWDVVAFVEVKSRKRGSLGHPLEAITVGKRRDLVTAARGWIARHGRPGQSFRFDAVYVLRGPRGRVLEHVPDAWRA